MARYIDGEQVIRELLSLSQTDGIYGRGLKRGIELALAIVNRQDTADVVEVKHGEWIDNKIQDSMLSKCSLCGYPCGAYTLNYCPRCGAKMDVSKMEITTDGGNAE